MRIISGNFRGRRLHPPTKMPARPTTDMAKEGLFNILQNWVSFPHQKTLDLYAGTGNISFEFASRGAEDITVVERNRKLIGFITDNFNKLEYQDNVRIVQEDVFKFLSYDEAKYDLIFADPPYASETMDKLIDTVMYKPALADEGIFILEHSIKQDFSKNKAFFRQVNYGSTVFSFFKHTDL